MELFVTLINGFILPNVTKNFLLDVEQVLDPPLQVTQQCKMNYKNYKNCINPLSVNFTKWSNTIKQFVG